MMNRSSHMPINVRAGHLAMRLLPGLLLCALLTAVARALEAGERALFGRAWLEALVLAILAGATLRCFWQPGRRWQHGIAFSARHLLEGAVMLLGASVSAVTLRAVGCGLLAGIAAVVAAALVAGFAIGRLLRLPPRLALLIACGNCICGNSAIAAVAPVIGAAGEEVAASITFTAVLGAVVVLCLPLLAMASHLSAAAGGAFAGLTVYAVPQVVAAAAPLGAVAVQMGMLVKLVRVLMLGPVCTGLALCAGPLIGGCRPAAGRRLDFSALLPWFIVGFLGLLLCRSAGWLPAAGAVLLGRVATPLTVMSMAALGLGVDMRTAARAGARVMAAATLSLAVLAVLSFAMLHILHFG